MANGSFHGDLLADHKTTIVSLTHQMNADSITNYQSSIINNQLTAPSFPLPSPPASAIIPAVVHLGESCDKWVAGLHGPDRRGEADMCAMAVRATRPGDEQDKMRRQSLSEMWIPLKKYHFRPLYPHFWPRKRGWFDRIRGFFSGIEMWIPLKNPWLYL
jgi:hypothetical protein